MEKGKVNILSIESAIGTGSVALIRDATLLSTSEGGSLKPSRAEDILAAIKDILSDATLDLERLSSIAVSTGPGSYSGIRIGIATALGLANSLGIVCSGVSLLEAIASSDGRSRSLIAAVPVGKNDVASQRFEPGDEGQDESSSPALDAYPDFVDRLGEFSPHTILAHRDLYERLSIEPDLPVAIEDVGTNMALLIGLSSVAGPSPMSLTPIYLRNRSHTGRGAKF